MNLNFQYIQYFITASQHQSLAKAALKHNVTASAISQGISKLEESLGVELLIHSKKKFELSNAGRLALPAFEKQLLDLKIFTTELKRSTQVQATEVKIATLRSLALAVFGEALVEIRSQHSSIIPLLAIDHTKNILQSILEEKVDLGVVVDNQKISGVYKKLLHRGRFCFVVHKNYISRLQNLDFLATQESPGKNEIQRVFKKLGKKATSPSIIQIESWEVIAKFASQGLGIGFVPDFVFKSLPHLDLVEVLPDFGKQFGFDVLLIARNKHRDKNFLTIEGILEQSFKNL